MECEYCIGAGKVAMGKRLDNGKLDITIVRCKRCNGTGKKLTNADRIRAMSDEELAKYLFDVEQGNFTIDCCDDRFCDTQNCCHDCTEAAIKWLKQPAEEKQDEV